MSGIELERDSSFLLEEWILYGIGVAVLALRFAVRFKTVGFRGLQMDDLFAFFVFMTYTYDAMTVHISFELGTNVEAAAFQLQRPLTPHEIEQYRLGSKLEFSSWYTYTTLLWSLKGTMLFFFKRITTGLWQARLVWWLLWVCLGSYLLVLLTVTFGCYPIRKNWQIIPSPGKCTVKIQNILVTAVLNIITDAAILCVPLRLLRTLQVPWKKKLMVGLLICSGFFLIAATIVRVILTLGARPSVVNINRWGVRETIVGIFCVNLAILRPMFRAAFWTGREPVVSSLLSTASPYPGGGGARPRARTPAAAAAALGPYEMTNGSREGLRGTASHDCILGADKPLRNDIYVETVYRIQTEAAHRDPGPEGWDTGGQRSTVDIYSAADAV